MDLSRRMITKIARNAARFTQRQGKALGLGSSEYEALHFIRKNPGACQDAVVQGLGMEKSAVAHLMAGLEQKGFITRTKDPQDNRRRLLFATPKAERLRDSRAALEAYYYQWLLETLAPAQRDAFLQTLELLYQKSKMDWRNGFAEILASMKDGQHTHESDANQSEST